MDDLTPERFFQILQEAAANFTCTRSGECCRHWGVGGVPGYNVRGEWTGDLSQRGYKPELHSCHHLQSARVVDGVWQPAACAIHDNLELFPDECRDFTIGTGPCVVGMRVWQTRKEREPEAELPERVKKLFDGRKS